MTVVTATVPSSGCRRRGAAASASAAVMAAVGGGVAPAVERHGDVLNTHLDLWGWEVAAYLFLGGLAAGLLIVASWAVLAGRRREYLPAVRVATLLVPPLIGAGLVLLWLDLGSKLTPFWLYVTLRPTSPMSWGAWILLAVLLTSSLAAIPALLAMRARASVPCRLPRLHRVLEHVGRWAARHGRWLAWINLWLGVGLGLYTGILLGTMVARPAWNSPMLGPLFLASGLSGAVALLLLLRPRGPWAPVFVRAEVGLHATKLALLGLYLTGLATSGAAPQAAAAALVRGVWAPAFWTLVVGAGMAVPLAVGLREVTVHRCPRRLAVASCTLALAGGLALRVVLVYAGQHGL
ncbi:MAG: NrfD/PsrC family molybdoenzyme membrane anchor subunit [Armatimonadota bacterium]|nr:NrfD/PsrC family molybdoenzyme membrane anchor subunit [Armatimonadota bacterium]